MSVPVICPNGHSLKIKDKYAGMKGLCPICKAHIEVPVVDIDMFNEDSIMDVLKPHESGMSIVSLRDLPDSVPSADGQTPPTTLKICHECHRQIAVDADVCPFCNTPVGVFEDTRH